MARTRPTFRPANSQSPQPANSPPAIAPLRKRPWLLALSIVLLVAWLAFMVVLVARH